MTDRARLERRVTVGLVAATAILGLLRLGASDVLDPEEARAVGIAQDVLRGHVLWPTFNDGVVPREPPGFHWLAAAAMAAGGFAEGIVRLPGVLAWMALVWLTARLGREFGAGPVGVGAAALLVASPGLAAASRSARPEVLFAAAATAALWCGWRWLRSDRHADAVWTSAAAAAATLVGGPTGLLLPFVVLGWTLGSRGELERIRRLATPLGLAIIAGACGGWYLGGALTLGEPFLSRHLGGPQFAHLARAFAWEEPWSERSLLYHVAFHPIGVVRMTLPWTPLAVLGLWRTRSAHARQDGRVAFLLAWAAWPLALFLWSRHKAWADVVVALPPLALLAAYAGADLLRRWPRPLQVGGRQMASAGLVALLLLAGVALVVHHPGLLTRSDRNWVEALVLGAGGDGTVILGVAALAGGLGAGIVAARAWPLVPPVLILLGLAWNLLGGPAVEQAASDVGSLRPFAAAVADVVDPDEPLVCFGRTQRPLVVYLDRVVPSLQRRAEALPTGAFVVLRARGHAELAELGRLSPALAEGGGRMHDGRPGHLVLARVLAPPPPRPGTLDVDP